MTMVLRFWVGPLYLLLALVSIGCESDSAGTPGTDMPPITGTGGAAASGAAATGAAATGAAATGAAATGAGGTGVPGTGAAATGAAAAGAAGTGVAGTGVAGTGAAGTGVADAGVAGAAPVDIMDGGTADGAGIAGAPGTAGTSGAGGASGSGGSVTTSVDPVIPPITGECPTFTNSTIDFMGLSGIRMQVGPMGNGGGSLIFYWHGTGSSNTEVDRLIPAQARQMILDAGGIIISPQTTSRVGSDCSGTGTFYTGDLDVADQIAACAVRDHNIDPHRIYATGCSAGGLFTGCMALNRPQYLAAAVPNSGGGMGRFASTEHIPAVMTMHGAPGVDVVIIDFSSSSASFDSTVKNAGGFVINCNHNGSHCRAPADLYTAAVQFMLDHPYGVDPEPYASALPPSFPSYCTIF